MGGSVKRLAKGERRNGLGESPREVRCPEVAYIEAERCLIIGLGLIFAKGSEEKPSELQFA